MCFTTKKRLKNQNGINSHLQHIAYITLSLINNEGECDRHSTLSHKWKCDKDIYVTTYLYRSSYLAVFWFEITKLILGFYVFYNQEMLENNNGMNSNS